MQQSTEEGVSLRRGQRRSKKPKAAPIFFYCIAAAIFVLFVVTWIIITQKTNHAIQDYAEATAESRNLGAVLPPLKRPIQQAPPGTSVVECTVKHPIDNRAPPSSSSSSSSSGGGVLTIYVWQEFAPIASTVFLEMVRAKHFDGCFIFRVLPGFIAQWGLRHKEILNDELPMGPIPKDKDPVTAATLSNVRGTLSFTGGNPRAKQVFVNLGNNERLDSEGSRPFATVDDSSMAVLDQLYMGYKDGQGQVKALEEGLEAIRREFPKWSQIGTCRVVLEADEEPQQQQSKK